MLPIQGSVSGVGCGSVRGDMSVGVASPEVVEFVSRSSGEGDAKH